MVTAVMVPLDGSAFAEHALPTAIDHARRSGAALHLVRVHQPPILPSPDAPVIVDAAWVESLRAEELSYVEELAGRVRGELSTAVLARLAEGFPADALSAYARSESISLIVMTTHGRGGVSRFWLGSVADALVRQSHVPVFLIRPHEVEPSEEAAPELRHILVPTDGSELSLSVTAPATALGGVRGARYTLLRVVPRLWTTLPMPPHEEVQAEERARLLAGLEAAAEPLRRSGAAVECAVVTHPVPAQAILEYAQANAVDAIALATRGRSGWARAALGSVADKVMRGSSLPVLLFRPPAPGARKLRLEAEVAGQV